MKIYKIPQNLKTIIFDIDGTLYTSPYYVFEQVDVQIRHFAHLKNLSESDAREKIQNFRKKWSSEHGCKKISLGNTLTYFGISIEESIKWREDLLEPSHFLHKDEKLHSTLEVLNSRYNLICLTNNPVKAAIKTLEAIGVADILQNIIGLDTCKKSKPAIEMIKLGAKETNSSYEECLSIGDRYDIDLALPLESGMGGILVDGVEEVYEIPEILKKDREFNPNSSFCN